MSARRILLTLSLALTLAAAGCLDSTAAFTCAEDKACSTNHCVAQLCATVDPSCPMGFRWDDSAGPRSGECAQIPDMAMALPDLVNPNCGNGKIDPGEGCDPGPGSPTPCPTNCDDGEPCTHDFVFGEVCQQSCAHDYPDLGDGAHCAFPDAGVTGVCERHACCTGCVMGGDCSSGTADTVCGVGGASCINCLTTGLDAGTPECLTGSCTDKGVCMRGFVTDGTTCKNGTGACLRGQCCTGCVDVNGMCAEGNLSGACGSGGVNCVTCACVANKCMNCKTTCSTDGGSPCGDDGCGGSCGACAPNQACTNGQCVCVPKAEICDNNLDDDCDGKVDCADDDCNLMRCMAGEGEFCSNGGCDSGCVIGGVLVGKGALNPKNSCQICDVTHDTMWTDVGDGTQCMAGNLGGTCHLGDCCTGCWDAKGNSCLEVATPSLCGGAGANCAPCDDLNPCTSDVCSAGVCMHPPVADGTKCAAEPDSCAGCGLQCLGTCALGPSCQAGKCSNQNEVMYQCCTTVVQSCVTKNGIASCKDL